MHWLITGGAGFIGSHLSEALLARGDEVTVLDNLSTGRLKNLAASESHPNFRFVQGSILDRALLVPLVQGCDGVYHLAAAVGVKLIISQPVDTIETNVFGTETLLSIAAAYRRRVFLASTSEVYGKNNTVPFREEDDSVFGSTTKSRWSYACSKKLDEFLALAYHRERQLPVTIVRFFNTVGPRQTGDYGMVLPRLVKQALRGDPLTVYGDGQQSRCFTHVNDAVRAAIALMDCPDSAGEVFNLGGQTEVSIVDLARTVIALSDSRSEICFVPYEDAYEKGFEDMQRRVPDVSKLQAQIGFTPNSDLKVIIRSVIDYHRTHIESVSQ